jgi:hypothetical protein
MTDKSQATQEKPKKRKGKFFWGCLTTLGVVVIIALVLSIVVFQVPLRIGLIKPAAERLLSQTPAREMAAELKTELQKSGLSANGVDIYVFPKKNSDKSVMLAVLDSSKGFYFNNTGKQDTVSDYLIKLATTTSSFGVDRVVFSYLGDDGKPIANVTAPTDMILKYSTGKISKTEFMKAIDANMDLDAVIKQSFP